MEIRKTIWDSKSEKDLFQSLHTQWSSKVNLYPHLPLCNIIKIHPEELTQKERDYYFKTEVDYTLCEQPNDSPILSIEFDGIGGGYSRNGEYIQKRETPDPNRKLKMDFKLRCASRAKYLFIVVSYDETEIFDEEDSVTILDGIIG